MKLSTRWRRRLWIAAGVLLLFTITGFFVLPPIVRSQIEQRLTQQLGRRVTLERVRINPYTLSITLQNFAILEPDGSTRFVGWRELYVNFDALSSLWSEWVLGEIVLDQFTGRVVIEPDGSFNFSDLLKKFAPPADAPAPSAPSRPIRIGSLKVSNTRADFTDRSRAQPFSSTIGPLTFALTNFRTVSERGAPYRFEAVTESGERLKWTGTLQADPLRSVGELGLDGILLPKYAPYYADRILADLASGTLSVRGRYELDLTPSQRSIQLHAGAVQLRNVKLLEPGSAQPVADVPTLDITGIEADALTQKATIDSIALDGGRVRVHRAKDGGINLLSIAPGSHTNDASASLGAAASPASLPSPSPALPDVAIREVTVKNFRLDVADDAPPRPAQLSLSGLSLSLQNLSLKEGSEMPMRLAFEWAPKGSVLLEGTVGLFPTQADLQLRLTRLELLPLSPYLEAFAQAHLTEGAVSASLGVKVALKAESAPSAEVNGDITVERFGLVDAAHNNDLAGFGALTLRGLHATTAPGVEVSLEEIELVAPRARVIVNPDQSLNLSTVFTRSSPPALAAPPPAPVTPDAPAATSALPKIEIATIKITDGDFRFTDRSLEPNVSMAIGQFTGAITGLSSINPGKGDVSMAAVVDGSGPVAITGKLDPLGSRPAIDLKVDAKHVDLLPLSPYTSKYAGYELARGQLLLDIKLLVDGKKIDSANVITLNQFTFGQPVPSPDATRLPVRLGVALLKDIEGKIVIDVPVEGQTDDPSFRIGRVVMRVIVNLLTKAAVSPFSLLGAAFGGGGEELAFQEFVPGTTELKPVEQQKLETMTKALNNRPGLSLAIDGSFDAAADTFALRERKLADQVRRTAWESKRQTDSNVPPPDQFAVSPEEEAAIIKRLFDGQFPPGTQFGTPLPQPPPVVSPPVPPAGWLKRLVRAVTFQARREQRAVERENEQRAAAHQEAVKAATAAGLPLNDMRARLAEVTPISDNELRELAAARARRVRDHFANVGKIAPERLFLSTAQSPTSKEGKGPRVFLSLQ